MELTKLVLKPTLYCFCNCEFCTSRQDFYKIKRKDKNILPLERIIKLFAEANKLGTKSLQISGGDPVLYPHLIEVIKEAKKYGWFIFINSVGYKMDEDKVVQLLESGLSAFNVSLDYASSTSHDKSRKLKGLWRDTIKTLKIINKLRENNIKYRDFYTNVQTIILNKNYKELPEILEVILNCKVSSWYLMNVYNDVAKEFTLKSNEIQYFKTIIVPQLLQVLERNEMSSEVIINAKKVLTTFFNNPRNTNDNYPKGRYWNRDQDIKSLCNQPLTTAMILQNGDVMPCCVLENKYSQTMGNIMQSSLEDIWNGEKYKLFREKRSAFCYFCPSAQNMTIGFVPSMLRQF